MEKFVNFWADMWKDEVITPRRKYMVEIAEKIKEKVTDVGEIEIKGRQLKKRKNYSTP